MDRKELKRTYKESPRTLGVFRVSNKQNERWYIGASLDVPAMLNRQRFQLEAGTHPNPALQRDWKRFGPDAFSFETLDRLEPPADQPGYDPRRDLNALEAMWHERLRSLYGAGYHDEKTPGA